MDKYLYFLGGIGGLIFIFLVLNQGGGKPAIGLANAGTSGAASIIKTLQGR